MKNTKNLIALRTIGLAALVSVSSCGAPSSEGSSEKVAEQIEAPTNGTKKSGLHNDFDISENGDSIIEFEDTANAALGKTIKVGTAYSKNKRTTYKSRWAPWQGVIEEAFNERLYKIYRFENNVSLPVKEGPSVCLGSGQEVSFVVPNTPNSTETVANMVQRTYEKAFWAWKSIGLEVGSEIGLGEIGANEAVTSESSIAVPSPFYEDIKEKASKTVSYNGLSTEYVLKNETEKRRFFEFHYRKTFTLYFVNQYRIDYAQTKTGLNTFGFDEKYDYEFKGFEAERTAYFLLPVDSSVTYVCDEYYQDEQGDMHIIAPSESYCVYL